MEADVYKVRAWRIQARMTQAELARAAGRSVQTISALESGRPVRRSTLDAVALALGVTLDELQAGPKKLSM